MLRASIALIAITLCTSSVRAQIQSVAQDLRLTLPAEAHVAVGATSSVYFDNIVLTQSPGDFRFEFQCDIGDIEPSRWTVTPTDNQIGDHPCVVRVKDDSGETVATGSTLIHIVPRLNRDSEPIEILFVGDSLTHATHYPNEVARLLRLSGVSWEMFGTHRPMSATEGVAHEGYGGWTWQRFAEKYEANPDGTHRKRSSPFVFLIDGKPKLDVSRYFNEHFEGKRPDVVFFLLGINDCFGANPESREAIDDRIASMLVQADRLLAEFRRAAPDADLAICLTPPPNSRESGFEANYKGRYHRWGWKRIQHRLVQRLMQHFDGRQPDGLFIVPTQLNLDPVDGYPDNNGVHPNTDGYRQIGATIYAWFCSRDF